MTDMYYPIYADGLYDALMQVHESNILYMLSLSCYVLCRHFQSWCSL
jgi:hypothetical protein